VTKLPERRPIIVLGAARSGTKLLRDTLAASRDLVATPYDLNFVWRTNNESHPSDALPADLCDSATARYIVSGLRRAAGLKIDDNRRLVEKTVSNTLRVEFVARVFPNADFVHIIRDGRDVVASSVVQWNKPVNVRYLARKLGAFPLRNYRYALWYLRNRLKFRPQSGTKSIWGVRYPGIGADVASLALPVVCAKQWLASVTGVQRAQENYDGLRLKVIRYEDLVSSESTLNELVQWLELPDLDEIQERYRRTIRPGRANSWRDALSAEDVDAVLLEIRPMLQKLGYIED
jgi:hypothetical protein